MQVRRGTYILVVTLESPRTVRVGALGEHLFEAGTYVYVGSAMGGLDQRLNRHLAKEKTIRWHIDYLTTICSRSEAFESYPEFVPECELANVAERCGAIPEVRGFGCSDCDCFTHLFRASDQIVDDIVRTCRLVPFRARIPL